MSKTTGPHPDERRLRRVSKDASTERSLPPDVAPRAIRRPIDAEQSRMADYAIANPPYELQTTFLSDGFVTRMQSLSTFPGYFSAHPDYIHVSRAKDRAKIPWRDRPVLFGAKSKAEFSDQGRRTHV
jgi:hypothetical protein